MREILYIVISLSVFIALFVFFQSNIGQTQAVLNPSVPNEQIDIEKEKFEPAKKMLLEVGVSFDRIYYFLPIGEKN